MRVGLFLAAFVLAAVAMLTSTPARAADGCLPPAGFMRSVQGQVEIKRGAVDWRPAALDEPLCAGDLIRVGDRSRALAAIANLTKRIDQNTTLSLTYVPEDKPSVVGLLEGAVYFFSRKPRILEVDTPFFDAAVEGTEFLVRVEPQRAQLTVFDGKITARNAQGELTVANGQSLTAEAGQAPTPSVLVRPRDAVQWALFYPIILLPLADARGRRRARSRSARRRGRAGEPRRIYRRLRGVRGHSGRRPGCGVPSLPGGDAAVGRPGRRRACRHRPSARSRSGRRPRLCAERGDRGGAERAGAGTPGRGARGRTQPALGGGADRAVVCGTVAVPDRAGARDDEPGGAGRAGERARLGAAVGAVADAGLSRPGAEGGEEGTQARPRAGADGDGARLRRAGRDRHRQGEASLHASDRAELGRSAGALRLGPRHHPRRRPWSGGAARLAVGLDPDDSLLRSYLGKAYFDSRITDPAKYLRELFTNFPNQENTLAAEQFAIAKWLDPLDPTPRLYDAIRKQSENRPVEALRDIEKSIELNDNRAVYRSRELLDQDRASRGTSLARIYNDLGFEQAGINEATKSLSLDPANAGAHRFLSDVYATQPRREVAQVSELLQAQLLQDININPVQPSLSETNLNIFTRGGPATPGFNEFTPLFERNQAQLNLSGEVGNYNTWADEAVVSGIYDQLSVSAGHSTIAVMVFDPTSISRTTFTISSLRPL